MNINKLLLACSILTNISTTQAMLTPHDASKKANPCTKQLAQTTSTNTNKQLDVATALKPTKKEKPLLENPDYVAIPLHKNKNRNPQLLNVKNQGHELYNDICNYIRTTGDLTVASALVIPPATHLFLLFSCAFMGYCPELSVIPFLSCEKTAEIALFFWAIMTPVLTNKKNNPLKKFYK